MTVSIRPTRMHWNHIRKDIERICDWGYTLIKHDFSTFDLFGKWGFEANLRDNSMEKWHFYDQTKTSAEIVKMLYQEIYDASPEQQRSDHRLQYHWTSRRRPDASESDR